MPKDFYMTGVFALSKRAQCFLKSDEELIVGVQAGDTVATQEMLDRLNRLRTPSTIQQLCSFVRESILLILWLSLLVVCVEISVSLINALFCWK